MSKQLPWLIEYINIDENKKVYDKIDMPLELYKKGSGFGLILVDGTYAESERWLKEESGIDEIWVEALLAHETRPRMVKINKDTLFLNLRGINSFNKEEPEDMISVRLYVTKKQIIGVKLRDLKAVAKVKTDLLNKNVPKTTFQFLIQLIEHINEEIENTILDIYEAIDELEEMVLIEHDKDFRQNVVDVRRQMIIFRRYFVPNLDVFHQLLNYGEGIGVEQDELSLLSENIHKMTRFIEDISSIKERAQVIHEELNNHLTERLSSTTNKLTMAASTFLPMTFITGLFGVNLGGIPGANNSTAFAVFTTIIVVFLLIQLLIFRWMKWM